MAKSHSNNLKSNSTPSVHGIRFVSEHLEPLEHRASTSAGKPVSGLRGIAEKNVALPPFLVVCSVSLSLLVLIAS